MTKTEKILASVLTVVGIFFTLTIFITGSLHNAYVNQRPATMIVREINQESDIVTLEDGNGFLWQIQGVEDWEIGDYASCIMDTKGTDSILDDEIKVIVYSGFYKRITDKDAGEISPLFFL